MSAIEFAVTSIFDGRRVMGGLDVDENARQLSNCFHAERQILHSLAGALPRVPDFELKILLGTQIWDVAQTLRDFSARLAELREHSDYPARPGEHYEAFLEAFDQAPSVIHQLAAFYRVLCPLLIEIYAAYQRECDPLMDEPTIRVLAAARNRHLGRKSEGEHLVTRLIAAARLEHEVEPWLAQFQDSLGRLEHIIKVPLRRRQTRSWPPARGLGGFARPANFEFGPDHGIDNRAIYGRPDEFYFPLDEQFQRHFLHHMVDAEMVAAEIIACNVHEFPDMPLAFHVDMSRQIWDEVRHAHVQWEILKTVGVELGRYPVYHAFDLVLYQRGLLERLILFNRLGEAGAARRHRRRSRLLRENGLSLLATLFDYLHADETPHVANGERWGKFLFTGPTDHFSAYCENVRAAFEKDLERHSPDA